MAKEMRKYGDGEARHKCPWSWGNGQQQAENKRRLVPEIRLIAMADIAAWRARQATDDCN